MAAMKHKRPEPRRVKRVAVTAAICACALLPPASAEGAARWTLRGAGWGHGIGMSQWGAYGFAKRGVGYQDILRHYYANTRIERRPPSVVRVLLQPNRSAIAFTGATRAGERGLEESSVYRATRSGANVVLRSVSGRRLETFAGVIPVSGGDTVRLLGRADNGVTSGLYRGSLEIRAAVGPGLNAINTVGMESYLQGVVPAESPPIWPHHALAAQAVAARSYALATGVTGRTFDQYADTRSQVYRGFLAETPSTNAAVADTRGQTVTYGGRVAVTYFFSTSGGHTENVENVFTRSDPKPWLKGVQDPYDGASPYHRWGPYTYSTRRLGAKLGGLAKGRFRSIKVLRRGVSPRVVTAAVRGTSGTVTVTGAQLRARLGLRDTWFRLRRISTSSNAAQARTASGERELAAIYGRVEDAPGQFVRLEKREGGRWSHEAEVPLTVRGRVGSYRFHVADAGSYRIAAGWAKGPIVRVSP
jgi:stage II sporulation protein D